MTTVPTANLEDVLEETNFLPGVIVGQEVSIGAKELVSAVTQAIGEFDTGDTALFVEQGEEWPRWLDRIDEIKPSTYEEVHRLVVEKIQHSTPKFETAHLVRSTWSVYISLAFDEVIERELKERLDRLPASKSVAIISETGDRIPQRSIPFVRLMGALHGPSGASGLALRHSSRLIRQQIWANILSPISEYIRDAPLFLFGTSGQRNCLLSLLSTLQSMPAPRPTKLVFQEGDVTLEDASVRALLRNFKCVQVRATVSEVADAIGNVGPEQRSLFAKQGGRADGSPVALFFQDFRDVIHHVEGVSETPGIGDDSARVVLDALHSPASLDWTPFQQGYDIRRSVTDAVKKRVELVGVEASETKDNAIVVRGEAGVGKTTVLKRVAFELANQGVFVLWATRAEAHTWASRYRSMVDRIKRLNDEGTVSSVAIFVDDPWELRVDPSDLLSIISGTNVRIACVFGLRNTDYGTAEGVGSNIYVNAQNDIEVPFTLDNNDVAQLVELLTATGAMRDADSAEREVAALSEKYASDILCSLWYCLPSSRTALTESLRDEYRRLGEVSSAVEDLAREASRSSEIAQRAYEYVTVASNLGIGLPMEVLVRALGVNYDEWLDVVAEGRPLWGLLYGSRDEARETIEYRTRNHVVTKILLGLLNRGVGHSGEHRVLMELLGGCSGGTLVYRDFVLEVLVRNRHRLKEVFTYEEGLTLYEKAESVVPYEDRSLAHQHGIWMKEFRQYSDAYSQLRKALRTADYPGAGQLEPAQHIHTSMAATVVQLVREGEQDQEEGLDVIKQHLREAQSGSYLDTYTTHVAANQLFTFAQLTDVSYEGRAAKIEAYGEALREIEAGLLGISGRSRKARKSRDDIGLLTSLQAKILDNMPDDAAIREYAEDRIRRTGSQVGYVVLARKTVAEATERGRGKNFNAAHDSINGLIEEVEDQGVEPDTELISVRADLLIRWQVRKFSSAKKWEQLVSDLGSILADPRHADNVLWRFYYAVALFHTDRITQSNALFEEIRRMNLAGADRRGVRAVLLGREGAPRRLQCRLFERNSRNYAQINEIDDTVPLGRPGGGDVDMSKGYVYLVFNLQGPLAVLRKPREDEIEVPRGGITEF